MKKMLFMLSLSIACTLSYAQDSNNELLKKLVQKQVLTQSEADSLSNSSTQKSGSASLGQTVEKVRQAFNTPYMKFGGYGMFTYKYSDVSNIKHSAEPRLIIISMGGELTKNFKYFILADFVKPTIYELYGDWTPSQNFNLRFGQMKTPLSIENQMSLTTIEGVYNTRSVSALMGMGDDVQAIRGDKKLSSTGRDIGIQAYGGLFKTETHNLLQYGIGVFQGSGISIGDDNNTKDLAANLMLEPIKNFHIGGGAYFGEATYLKSGDASVSDHVRNRWIVSSDYKTDRFYARSEWIRGNDGGISKEGLHGVGLWYFIPKKLNGYAKVDYLNQDKKTNNEVIDYSVGVNYFFYPSCRFHLSYMYSDYSNKWNAPNSNTVMGQFQVVF